MIRKSYQRNGYTLLLAAGLVIASVPLSAQVPLTPPLMVPVPIATAYAGIPTATYNGTTAGTPCPSTTPGYVTTNDGCPASAMTLDYTYNLAIDPNNNLAIANYGTGANSTAGISLIYSGGTAMANALIAAKPGFTFTPMVGHGYQLANGGTLKPVGSPAVFYCNGSTTSTVTGLDPWGDGCPAEYANSQSRGDVMDSYGNIFFSQVYQGSTDYQGLKVLYVGGTAVANLITSYFNYTCKNWPITVTSASSVYLSETTQNQCAGGITPTPGHVYALSSPGDFVAIRGIGIQVNPTTGAYTLYATDNGTQTAVPSFIPQPLGSTTMGNQMKVFTGTTWATFINGNTTGGNAVVQGDGGTAASAFLDVPTYMVNDQYGNLYIEDVGDDRVRVVYNGGTTVPLYVQGGAIVTSPKVGYVYSAAGGGASRTSPSVASTLSLGGLVAVGVDAQQNLYVTDSSKVTWVIYANAGTGVAGEAVAIGGGVASTTVGALPTVPGPGAACNGSTAPTTGPLMLDAYGDGCPATEISPVGASGVIAVDTAGNFYEVENRQTGAATAIVRKYSYNNQFGLVAPSAPVTNLLAFTPFTRTSTYTPTVSYSLGGNASTDFTDTGTDNCSTLTGSNTEQICTYNVTFTPAMAGSRLGSITLASTGTTLVSEPLTGVGSAAQIALDPATQTTIGTTYSPLGVGVDQSGNLYISDGTSNSVVKSVAGAAPAVYATGFISPAQIAVTGSGNLFVADSGNNRVALVTKGTAPVVATTFISTANSVSLSKPSGVAVDGRGDVFIADTGNNRVLELPYDQGIYADAVTLGFTGLSNPMGLAVDAAGDLFVADSGNARIVELTAAGVQQAITVSPALVKPVGVGIDPAGDLFIADATNQNVVTVPVGTTTATTLRGSIVGLTGLAADSNGDVVASATSLTGAIAFNRSQITVKYPQTNIGQTSVEVFSLTNSGNLPLSYGSSLDSSTDVVDYTVAPATTNGCSTSSTLAVGGGCSLSGTFGPQLVASALSTVVTFPSSNAVGSSSATLTGQSQMGLAYSFGAPGTLPNTIVTTLTATLSVANPSTPIGGTVTFLVGTTSTTVPVSGGTAVLTQPLTAGVYNVVATYNPGTNYGYTVTASLTMTVVTGTSSVALSVTSPTGAITYGEAVVVTALTTTGNSTNTPGGTVAFSVGGVVKSTVPYAASTSATLNLVAGTYSVTATYSGDANYVPSHATITVVVGRATPTLNLAPTPNVGGVNSITLTATMPAAPTFPTGNITFSSGSTSYGSVALTNGVAATTVNTVLLNTFTAVYSGDANYLPVTVTITASPVLVLSATPASLVTLQNSVATIGLALNSFYLYGANSIAFSCTNLPAFTTCAANAASITSSQQIVTVPLQFFTDVSPLATQSKVEWPARASAVSLAGFLLIGCLSGFRKRRFGKMLLVLMAFGTAVGFTGCATSTSSTAAYVTPTGTYTINIIANDGTTKYTLPYSVTVNPNSLAARPN